MKKLFLMAVLAIGAYTSQAQVMRNASPCDLYIREICIDPVTCTVSGVGNITPWPAYTFFPLPTSPCPPDVTAYEVGYDFSSTGCSDRVVVQPTSFSATCNTFPSSDQLPPCVNCNPLSNGLRIVFDDASGTPTLVAYPN